MTDRVKIRAGSKRIGERIGTLTITGFGKPWTERVTDDNACVYGLEPGRDHHLTMQYAYGTRS